LAQHINFPSFPAYFTGQNFTGSGQFSTGANTALAFCAPVKIFRFFSLIFGL